MDDDKAKCVLHPTVDATTTVGRSIPVCAGCASQYQVEVEKCLPYREQQFYRKLKWRKQALREDAEARARPEPPPTPAIPELHPDFAMNEAASRQLDDEKLRHEDQLRQTVR